MRPALFQPRQPNPVAKPSVVISPTAVKVAQVQTPSLTGGNVAGGSPVPAVATPAGPFLGTTISLPTPPPGASLASLVPVQNGVVWVDDGGIQAHFGDRGLRVGFYQNHIYKGAIQFRLQSIPQGSQVIYAALALTGLSTETWHEEGKWPVVMLDASVDKDFANQTADALLKAPSVGAVGDALVPTQMGLRQTALLPFSDDGIRRLTERLGQGTVSLRLEGPETGADNLFVWDSGYGQGVLGRRPTLYVQYLPPPTPTFVVITLTPTPANIVTQVAQALEATSQALTATPTPIVGLLATPTPLKVIVPPPVPGNDVTATWQAALTSAQIFLTGTPTPVPPDAITATPTATYVVVTPPPTPANSQTAVARAVAAARSALIATPTATPPNMVTATPIKIIIPTETPGNAATAVWQGMVATAQAFLTGTPTPIPPGALMATPVPTQTPVPLFIPLNQLTPTPTATAGPSPTPTPGTMPAELRGNILFLSDRLNPPSDQAASQAAGKSALLMMANPLADNPAERTLSLLTNDWAYKKANSMMGDAPDGVQRVFVAGYRETFELWLVNLRDGWTSYLLGRGGINYDPAWSPNGDLIAYVNSGPGGDQIMVVDKEGKDPQQLTNFVKLQAKHPSWSPDGQQLIFWTNRDDNLKHIYIINVDGTDLRRLSDGQSNDWDPVWIH
ncbi:MAG: PD40 domain-containing protein [Chloroflexi bacterium]|nr:PD40 domain-containing protein [Chloroflexota bacterium]